MNRPARVTCSAFAICLLAAGTAAQAPKPTTSLEKQSSSPRVFGQSYATLLPEQKKLVDDFVRRYNETTGNKATPEEAYNNSRQSVRTTFDAITHALLSTNMTNAEGHPLGRAIDLVDAIDEVMGEEAGARGDQEFRMYVYLKPKAFEILGSSREFFRDKDNTVYHPGFPLCYRLKNGPPSIQFSISRDERMSDIDVDYRSSTFPKALFDGHLTAGNSDVRAGNNLDTHDNRWAGLNGWWREVFGFSLGNSAKPSVDATTGKAPAIPANPRVKADEGIDASVHDFLKSWVVDRKPNMAVAYLSRLSYPCLENMAQGKKQEAIAPGMLRFHTLLAMERFNASLGSVTSVTDVFDAATNWKPGLKEGKNSYPAEFRLVEIPQDMARDQECVQGDVEEKKSKEQYYGTAFRGKQGDGRNKVMSLLWAKQDKYWKIVAIRVDDSSDAGFTSKAGVTTSPVTEPKPEMIAGDPGAVKDVTSFYQLWIGKRDPGGAARYVSERSYQCLAAPLENEKGMKSSDRIQNKMTEILSRVPQGTNLSDMMSSVQPVNELVRPVKQEDSKAFAMMAVPDQMAGSFFCQTRQFRERTAVLKPADAKYGAYYLSASRLNYGAEQSPALLLLWTRENDGFKIVAWAVEVP